MEIGSVYEIDPVKNEKYVIAPHKELRMAGVLKYGKKNMVYTASGREAIELALYSLEREERSVCKKCLMPAYMCDTVFIPFKKKGWELIFYHVGKDMKADGQELDELIKKYQPGILFIHAYYGVDTWKELRPALVQYQKEGLLLMEDVTQSYYMRVDSDQEKGIGFGADYIVGSLRKWYAVPDGGFVVSDHLLYPEVTVSESSFWKRRLDMQIKKWNYLDGMQNRKGFDSLEKQCWAEHELPRLLKEKETYLAENRQLENELDHYEEITGLSALSHNMLLNVNEKACEKRRSENYRLLHEGLKNRKSLVPVFTECVETAAPLYMPVYMKDRDALQSFLRERDIYVPVLWPVGKENAECLNEEEQYIFSHLAAIPMDQRYGSEEMKRIIDVIEEYERLKK